MQFLFVVLMSVMVGASTLPHLMQAPNRPSFSLRKNTAFSLVAIPKFLKKVATLESDKLNAENEAAADAVLNEADAETDEDRNIAGEYSDEQAMVDSSDASTSVARSENANERRGTLILNSAELTSCICKEDSAMDCQLSLDGFCSRPDDPISVDAKTSEGPSTKKTFRCKMDNHFSGYIPVTGSGVGNFTIDFAGQRLEQPLNMINECASFKKSHPQSAD